MALGGAFRIKAPYRAKRVASPGKGRIRPLSPRPATVRVKAPMRRR